MSAAGFAVEKWHDFFLGIVGAAAALPVIAAGVSIAARAGGGLYWLVPAIILLLGVGLANAWVLLVEIVR